MWAIVTIDYSKPCEDKPMPFTSTNLRVSQQTHDEIAYRLVAIGGDVNTGDTIKLEGLVLIVDPELSSPIRWDPKFDGPRRCVRFNSATITLETLEDWVHTIKTLRDTEA